MHQAHVLDQLVAASRELYSLPTVAVRVLELTAHPGVDSIQLKRCIERDPALTAKLLRVVNSSLFGMSSQIADLNQAITILGIKPLKLLVLGFCLPERLFQNQAGELLAWYWRRTLTKAVAAREVAQQVWRLSGDEGFVVGLLADLGLLAFVQGFGAPYVQFLRRVREHGQVLEAAERHALGFDHRQFTSRLIEQWNLPAKLCEAIVSNATMSESVATSPNEQPSTPLASVLHQADLLTQLLCDARSGVLGELLQQGPQPLNEEQLNTLVTTLRDKVEQLAGVLQLELIECRDYQEILNESRRQLAILATDAAAELAIRQRRPAWDEPLVEQQELYDEISALNAAVASYGCERQSAPRSCMAVRAASSLTNGNSTGVSKALTTETTPQMVLREQISLAVQVSRQARSPLSLLIIEIASLENPTNRVHDGSFERCEGYFELLETEGKVLVPLNQDRLAVGLIDCDRKQLSEVTRGLLQFLRGGPWGRKASPVHLGAATVSCPSPNFDVERLIDAAERCCYASRAAGGNVLKSIEIY